MAEVYVKRGEEELVATLLLELADQVHHVQSSMDGPGGLMFIVPDELHDRYVALRYGTTEESADEAPAEEVAPAPKRRGRPPKVKTPEPTPVVSDDGEDEE